MLFVVEVKLSQGWYACCSRKTKAAAQRMAGRYRMVYGPEGSRVRVRRSTPEAIIR